MWPAIQENVMDFQIANHGSVALLCPISPAGERWANKNLVTESWQHFGGAIAIEPRALDAIIEGIELDGLEVG